MLGTEGVILPSPTVGYSSMLKFGLMYSKANEGLPLSEEVCHCLSLAGPRGGEVMAGGISSVTSLWEPAGLQRPSSMLEPMGMETLRVRESSMHTSCHLHPLDLADSEVEWLCL